MLSVGLVLNRLLSPGEPVTSQVVSEILGGVEIAPPDAKDERWYSGWIEQGDAIARYSSMATRIASEADDLIQSYIKLLAVLLFNLILLPMILIGGVFVLFRWVANDALA